MDIILPHRSRTDSWKECHQTPSPSHQECTRVLSLARFGFLYNDLPNCVNSSTIRLFADDCLIYKEIHSQQDTEDLQTDLDALQTWERRWLMSFHPQKCQLLRITRKPSPIIAQYNIHGHVLEVADTAKYLGVTLHKHCAWSKHINQTTKKANNTRAFLQRNLHRAPTSVKKQAYETLVRPIVETAYAGSVWDPHTEADIYKREMVQCRYARYTCNNFGRTSSVTAMLHQIGWDILHELRAKSRLAMQFRIAHNLVDIPAADHLQTYNFRKGNAAKFRCHMHGLWPVGIASSLMLPECGMPSHLTW